MMKHFNITNIRNFIKKFTAGRLKRTLSSVNSPKSHIINVNVSNKTTSRITTVKELTTSTFLPTVMQLDQVVVILYHSIKCAFCSGIGHVFLAVARLLRPITNLHFARIDGDDHMLPWEYSMHQYPTILFFPSQKYVKTINIQ